MKFPIFGLNASVDIRPLPGAWVTELLGVVLGVQDHKKDQIQFPISTSLVLTVLTFLQRRRVDSCGSCVQMEE